MTKTVILGLGAQKAGTTWVYQYLLRHPECAMGQDKELSRLVEHFQKEDTKAWKLKRLEALEDVCKKTRWRIDNDKATSGEMQQLLERVEAFCAAFDTDHYLNFFDRRFAAHPNAKVSGDLTPENCLLGTEDLAQIKSMLKAKGYRAKVLFIMRDPVERCYSAMRMGHRRALKAGKEIWDPSHTHFTATATGDWCQIRTRYQDIIPRIDAVFAPEDQHIAFYESLFSEEGVKLLCEFLDITYIPTELEKRVNSSPRDSEPSADAWNATRLAYKDTYDFCAQRYGAELISDLWGYRSAQD